MNNIFNIRQALENEPTEFLRSRIRQAEEPTQFAKQVLDCMAQDVEWLKAHPNLSDKIFELLKTEEIPAASFNKYLQILIRADLLKSHPHHHLALFERACQKGVGDLALLLIKKGLIDRTLVNNTGENAVHIAARYGERELVLALLSGASFMQAIHSRFRKDNPLAITNVMGQTPAEVAYLNGHTDLSIILIEKGSPLDNQDVYGNTLLHMVASRGDKAFALVLGQYGAYLNLQNFDGNTPLQLAAQNGLMDMVSFFKARGSETNSVNFAGKTPLQLAVEANVNVAQLKHSGLLENKVINVEDEKGQTPLFSACLQANGPVALELLQQGAKMGPLVDGLDTFYLALRQGMTEVAIKLLPQITDIHAHTGAYLYAAYLSGKPEIVEIVMAAGAVFDKKCISAAAFSGMTEALTKMVTAYVDTDKEAILKEAMEGALYGGSIASFETIRALGAPFPSNGLTLVANSGSIELLNHLISHHVVKLPEDIGGALFKAAEKGKGPMVKRLLELGADFQQPDAEGNYPLHLALKAKSEDTALLLLTAGAPINIQDKMGNSPLHLATHSNLPLAVKILLQRGVAVNVLNQENDTPIFYAKNPHMASLLLENGAQLNRFNLVGFNVLHEAVDSGNLPLVHFYRRRASALLDVPAVNRAQFTPREIATLFEDENILQLYGYKPTLEERKQLINTPGYLGATPLMTVCAQGDIGLVRSYLSQGADLHAVDDAGQTALFHALESRDPDLIQLLFEKGANVNQKNNQGDSVLKVAFQLRYNEVLEKLLDLGADVRIYWKDTSFLQRLKMNALNFSPAFLQKVEKLDGGFTEEILSAKFLAHTFSLAGEGSLEGQKFKYTGNRNEDVFTRYRKHLDEGYRAIMEDWRVFDAVRQRLDPEAKHVLRKAKLIFPVLQLMPQIFDEAVVPDREQISVSRLRAKLQSGRPQMFYGGWDKHAVGSVIYGTQVARANRGEGAGEYPGILINYATNFEHVLQEFSSFEKVSKSYFTEGIHADLDIRETFYLEQTRQKVSNCTLATLRSLEYATLYHLLCEHFNDEVSAEIAHSIKRQRTLQSRDMALEDYLEAHKDPAQEAYPPNLHLLRLILAKKTHEPEEDTKRNQKIQAWAAARGIKF